MTPLQESFAAIDASWRETGNYDVAGDLLGKLSRATTEDPIHQKIVAKWMDIADSVANQGHIESSFNLLYGLATHYFDDQNDRPDEKTLSLRRNVCERWVNIANQLVQAKRKGEVYGALQGIWAVHAPKTRANYSAIVLMTEEMLGSLEEVGYVVCNTVAVSPPDPSAGSFGIESI